MAPPTGTEATPLSEGYWSEDGESGEEMVEGEVEMVEDYAALEEEGVIVTDLKKSKFAIRKVCVCVYVCACVCVCTKF